MIAWEKKFFVYIDPDYFVFIGLMQHVLTNILFSSNGTWTDPLKSFCYKMMLFCTGHPFKRSDNAKQVITQLWPS